MLRYTLFIFFGLFYFSIYCQNEPSSAEQWKIYKRNQKVADSIHKLMKGTYYQELEAEQASDGKIDTLMTFEEYNSKLEGKEFLFSKLVISRKGKYSQNFSEPLFKETLRGRTTTINFESDSLMYIRLAVVLREKGLTQLKFHSYSNNTLILQEINSQKLHYFRKE